MCHVFISYKREERDFAELVKAKIQLAGYKTWLDSDNLSPGIQWRESIDNAIKNALAVVVILTPDAHQSAYITYEWSYAIGVGIPIVPLLLRKTDLHPRLEAFQFLDFTDQKRDWHRFIGRIKELAVVAEAQTHISTVRWSNYANLFWLGGDLHTLAHLIWSHRKKDILRAARQSQHHTHELALHDLSARLMDLCGELEQLDYDLLSKEKRKELNSRIWGIIKEVGEITLTAQPSAKLWPDSD